MGLTDEGQETVDDTFDVLTEKKLYIESNIQQIDPSEKTKGKRPFQINEG